MGERIDIDMTRPRKYPWDKWADGSTWRIQRGIDYEIPSASMAAQIRSHALRNEMRVMTSMPHEIDGVQFQFSKASGRRKAAA
jgi:hypothetical protein